MIDLLNTYELLFEHNMDAVLLCTLDGKVIRSNPAARSMFGMGEAELCAAEENDLFDTSDPRFDPLREERRRSGKCRGELTCRRKDGSRFQAEITSVVQDDGQRGVVIIREVAEHRWAEEAIRESEERFRNMADNSPVIIWVTAPDGQCTSLNKVWYDFTGQTQESAMGYGWLKAVHPEDVHRAAEIFLTANARREPFHLDYRLRHHDGQYRWCIDSGAPRFGPQGEFFGYVGSVLDITDRKRAEDALKESQKQFQDLVETLKDWVWEVDTSGVYTYASPRVRELLGYEPQEVVGKRAFDFMPPDEARRVAGFFQEIVEKREPFNALENINLHKDGHRVVLETSALPFFENGKFKGYRGVDRDITARKEAEENLRQSAQMKSEFVSIAAHEFRTPLTSMQGFSELLLNHDDLPLGERKEFLTYIHEASGELSRIVADLLDIARIEQGHELPLHLERGSVREMLSKVEPFLKARAIDHHVEMSLEAENTPLTVDRGKVGQVMENLISNALKYSPEGSTIHIRGEKTPEHYQISVIDHGIGMTPEQVGKRDRAGHDCEFCVAAAKRLIRGSATDAAWTPYLYLALSGSTLGGVGAAAGALWPERYGTRHIGAIRSVAQVAMVFSTAIAPFVLGALLDAGLSPATAGLILAALVTLCASLVLLVRPPAPR